LDGIRTSFLATERPENQLWDHKWRAKLVDHLDILANQLWEAGVTEIFINGSFVEDKDHPNDIDGYFVCERKHLISGELQRDLNLLDPYKVWTWSPEARMPAPGFTKRQLPMWHRYRVELWPHIGLTSGIKDEHGNDQEVPAAFRKTRDLAERLDVHESQVSRDERNDYHGITIERASRVLDALGVNVKSTVEGPLIQYNEEQLTGV